MRSSIREQLLQTLVGRLTPMASAHRAGLLRSPTLAVLRKRCPALLLFPVDPKEVHQKLLGT